MTDIVIVQSPNVASVVSVGVQGPPGPRGADGAPGPTGPSGATVTYAASQDLSGHRLVRLNDGQTLSYASALNLQDANFVVGMTLNAALAGDPVDVLLVGEVEEPSWGWTPNQPIYLGADGYMTQVPAPGSVFSLVVGFPISPTKAFISIREPIILTQ